jgi:hypothetical protein
VPVYLHPLFTFLFTCIATYLWNLKHLVIIKNIFISGVTLRLWCCPWCFIFISSTLGCSLYTVASPDRQQYYQWCLTYDKFSDSAHALFVRATYLVCHRLISAWKQDLNVSLAALELLSGLARTKIRETGERNTLQCATKLLICRRY